LISRQLWHHNSAIRGSNSLSFAIETKNALRAEVSRQISIGSRTLKKCEGNYELKTYYKIVVCAYQVRCQGKDRAKPLEGCGCDNKQLYVNPVFRGKKGK
jgi:hypothetical protein